MHYNLHVMLRFDLERALIAGDLEVADLDAAWNERFLADFGQPVPDARRGVLQDVHWPAAAFGYFPTYTLGTIYAAELDAAMRRDLDLDAGLAAGDLGPAIGWLNARIHRHGRLLPARRLIAEAIGREPDERALVGYLEAKFRALYGLLTDRLSAAARPARRGSLSAARSRTPDARAGRPSRGCRRRRESPGCAASARCRARCLPPRASRRARGGR